MTAPRDAGFPAPPSDGHILCVEEGLERLMGDRRLYLQLLRRLRLRYASCPVQLQQALAQGEFDTLQRTVHTLKGAAGMVGAQQVYRHCQRVEQSCSATGSVCATALDALAAVLASLLGMIDSVLEGVPDHTLHESTLHASAPAAAPLAVAPAAARRQVQQLAQLLADGDGAAIDVLEQSASVLAASLGVAVFQEVAAAAHQFEFEAALALLQAQRPR